MTRSPELRNRVRLQSHDRCAYCHAPQALVYNSHEIDHIIPPGDGGSEHEDNLCLCCRDCNLFKSDRTVADDPLTNERVAIFHPRQQMWNDHFRWDREGVRVEGLTATGRATVALLRMNADFKVGVRKLWVALGVFPPTTDSRTVT